MKLALRLKKEKKKIKLTSSAHDKLLDWLCDKEVRSLIFKLILKNTKVSGDVENCI